MLKIQRTKLKQQFDHKNNINTSIKEGDLVLVWDRPFKTPFAQSMKKLEPRWSGPYEALDRFYKLSELDNTPMERLYTREMLKIYYV
ncbi:uncharacterized protein KGF55_005470 [Candida pseudojiufengensis]|uniref:uncharacterized protein n=1 Tax=Candida pseudojiufengensis TaxID=497109 RepID=UPI002224E33F|nr:uncharacterized protein KGF55_005470 [Candida pseudojiufengensis]KAI5959320.1 hypothetical protein KGF55_005470 [Candida pseudojiufengensis]